MPRTKKEHIGAKFLCKQATRLKHRPIQKRSLYFYPSRSFLRLSFAILCAGRTNDCVRLCQPNHQQSYLVVWSCSLKLEDEIVRFAVNVLGTQLTRLCKLIKLELLVYVALWNVILFYTQSAVPHLNRKAKIQVQQTHLRITESIMQQLMISSQLKLYLAGGLICTKSHLTCARNDCKLFS